MLSCRVHLPLGRFVLDVAFQSSVHMLGVLGPSGSGKTTLVEVLCGLRRGVRGSVACGAQRWLDSAERVNVAPEQRGVGYVPQHGSLFPHLDVRGNLLLGRARAERNGLDFQRMFASVVEMLELRPLLAERCTVLSGGERQRVALARALCSGPTLLLLDEPFAALDLPLRRRLLPFLRRVREELTVPTVFVTHDPIEAQALCDEVVLLSEGRVLAQGAPRRVLVQRDTGVDGFQNVWPVRLKSAGDGRSVVLAGDLEIHVRSGVPPHNAQAWLSVSANQVLIGTELPVGLSAANVWPARVVSILQRSNVALVELEVRGPQHALFAELAPETLIRLGLREQQAVYAIVKSSSCALLGALPQ
jgi:molybdate transport system ATP-binding protein